MNSRINFQSNKITIINSDISFTDFRPMQHNFKSNLIYTEFIWHIYTILFIFIGIFEFPKTYHLKANNFHLFFSQQFSSKPIYLCTASVEINLFLQYTEDDIYLNSRSFLWPNELEQVLELSGYRLGVVRENLEVALK